MSTGRELFPSSSSTAYDRYGRDLSEAIRGRTWVADPSFALGTDDMVYEKIRRDAVTAQAIQYRKHLVTGRSVTISPPDGVDDPASKKAAVIVEALLGELGMFSDGRFNLSEAIFRGSAYAFIEGEEKTISIAGDPALSWWAPRKLADVDRRRFRLRPVASVEEPNEVTVLWFLWSVARQEWEPLRHPEWFVKHFYTRTEDTLNYGRGLIDALHFYQASKMRVLQEGLSAVERFGQGFLKVGIDGMRAGSNDETNSTQAQAYVREIEKHRARNVLAHDKEDNVELVTGFGEGWQLVREMLSHLDSAIRTLILGANLTTSATTGGSFALAQVQENSTEALIQFDRELLSETLTRDLVGLIWRLNVGNFRALGLGGARMPVLRIRQEKREDPGANAIVITQAIQAGIPLRRDEVYEKLGFTAPQDDDEVIGSGSATQSTDLDELPSGLTPGLLTGDDVAAAAPTSAPADVQDAALNGAQITALQGIIQQVAAGLLPAEAARELVASGFPSITPDRIARMIGSAESFNPPPTQAEAPVALSRLANGNGGSK